MKKTEGITSNPLVMMIEESIRLKESAQVILSEAIEGTSLTRLERLVLMFICENEELMTVPQIGRHSGHTRQVVQRVANQLEALGLIRKLDNPHHKTAALLQATAKGLKFERNMKATLDDIIGGIFTASDLKACERITRDLNKLKIKLERYQPE